MKKIITLFILAAITMTAKAVTATVYVEAEKAPYLYAWYNKNKKDIELLGKWPGTQLTESVVVNERTFWKMQITSPADIPAFNIIFNDGGKTDANGKYIDKSAKQTPNITGISTDRYFTYDGVNTYADISSEMGIVVPDAEVTSLALLSKVFGNWDVNTKFFTEVEKNKKYECLIDLTDVDLEEEEDCFFFELFANGSAYLGFNSITLADDNTKEWVEEDKGNEGDNLLIDVSDEGINTKIFTLIATWTQGKYIEDGWTLKVEKGNSTGISAVRTANNDTNKAAFNLAGQRVDKGYKGIVVKNGKKIAVK